MPRLTRSRAWLVAVGAFVAAIVGARIALPFALRAYLNRVLAQNPSYTGTVGSVGVALYRGAYQIHDVDIRKRGARVPVPFVSAPLVDVSVEWRALLHGSFVAEVVVEGGALSFVAGPTDADQQSGVAGHWKALVEKLFPAEINRFEVRDAKVHFQNFQSKPRVDVSLQHVDVLTENLSNDQHREEARPARLDMRGVFQPRGRFVLRAALDAHAKTPDFDCDLVVKDIDLRSWNDLLRAYAKLDVQRGTLSVYAELEAENGSFRGYVKPFLTEVEVLGWNDGFRHESLLSAAWEAFVQGVLDVFKNRAADDVATRIPLTGQATPRGELWPALGNAIYNAFVEGLAPRLEHSVGERRDVESH